MKTKPRVFEVWYCEKHNPLGDCGRCEDLKKIETIPLSDVMELKERLKAVLEFIDSEFKKLEEKAKGDDLW